MAVDYTFTEEDFVIHESLGHPKAFSQLCRDRFSVRYSDGPPFSFLPYNLQPHEAVKVNEFEDAFPIINPKAKPTEKPQKFLCLLWKKLNHLGNAGFDPAIIRVDPYGNVLYYHADSASPLAWKIDHWFPCSRGGLTVPSNLRILQWQVCKKKQNKLDFLVPWWDLQLGVSINQFLSIFASSNSNFRHRAFSFLFYKANNEELSPSQTVETHTFPQKFIESKQKLGFAPAAIVVSQGTPHSDISISPLKPLNSNNSRQKPSSSLFASCRQRPCNSKENAEPNMVSDPYQAIVMARNSLKQREKTLKMQAETQVLDNEVIQLNHTNEEERVKIQNLELSLIKHKRHAEKCRRLAEEQNSYRTTLEKMIREAMHQSVIYKEQVRLNHVASNALMATLEAQRTICDASERELLKKLKQRKDIEEQIRPPWDKTKKRSRSEDVESEQKGDNKTAMYQPERKASKELRVFLEEEHKLSADKSVQEPLEPEIEEDEETRKMRGKGNVERWLQILMENAQEGDEQKSNEHKSNAKIGESQLDLKFGINEVNEQQIDAKEGCDNIKEKSKMGEIENSNIIIKDDKIVKERKIGRSESARIFRRIPSSPSIVLGFKGKKSSVNGDEDHGLGSSYIKSSIKTIKRAMRI